MGSCLKLEAMGIKIDKLTPEQEAYLNEWRWHVVCRSPDAFSRVCRGEVAAPLQCCSGFVPARAVAQRAAVKLVRGVCLPGQPVSVTFLRCRPRGYAILARASSSYSQHQQVREFVRALITGVGGFVGNHLAEHLLEQGDVEVFGDVPAARVLPRPPTLRHDLRQIHGRRRRRAPAA